MGIGTTTAPTEKLVVNGNISYTGNLIMGVQYISLTANFPGNSFGSFPCACPTGTKLIGGGGGYSSNDGGVLDVFLVYSGPDPNNSNRWLLLVKNTGSVPRSFTEYAICAKVQ